MRSSLFVSTMLLIMGLMSTASRKTTNSKPSLDTSVTYLLTSSSAITTDGADRSGSWLSGEGEQERGFLVGERK